MTDPRLPGDVPPEGADGDAERRVRAAFDDLRRQADGADPSLPLADIEFEEKRAGGRKRSWAPAAAAAAMVVVAVGVIAIIPRGDDPTADAQPTTTIAGAATSTTASATTAASTASTLVPSTTVPVGNLTSVALLSDGEGVTATLDDGTPRRIADWSATVAFGDGVGGVITQDDEGRIDRLTVDGRTVTYDSSGTLQQVVVDPSEGAGSLYVLERVEIPDTEVFDGAVVRIDLDSGVREVVHDRGDVTRYSTDGGRELFTIGQEEFTALEMSGPDPADDWTYTSARGGFLRHGVLQGDLLAVFDDSDVVVIDLNDLSERVIPVSDQFPLRLEWLDGSTLSASYAAWDSSLTVADDVYRLSIDGAVERLATPGILTVADLDLDRLGTFTRPAPVAAAGWRVVGVASDDHLNVREGPGAEHQIIGRLDHDDVDVRLNGAGSVDLDGTPWWGVRLVDGFEGYVSSEFLAPPTAWTDDLRHACGGEPIEAQVPLELALTGGSDANALMATIHQDLGDCHRYVFVMGAPGPDRLGPAETVAIDGTLSVVSTPGEVHIEYPPSVGFVDIPSWGRIQGPALVMPTVAGVIGEPGPIRSSIFSNGGEVAGVSVFSGPARIVVDIVGAASGGGEWIIAEEGSTVLLGPPVDRGPDGVEVRGFGSWFEAAGFAELRDADGNPVDVQWDGPSLPAGSSTGSTSLVYAPYTPAWGEFALFLKGLPPGTYELFTGTECYDPETDSAPACGVSVEFTVP